MRLARCAPNARFFFDPVTLQTYDRIGSVYRCDPLHTEFSCFLNDQIHALATRNPLYQPDRQWRFDIAWRMRTG